MADLQSLGDYEILKRIATGGMGTVYLARHTGTRREVALKVLSAQMSEDPEFVARFQREAQATAALRHPHIVQVYDTGAIDGQRYIAMEYLSGGNLQQELVQLTIKNQQMPVARALQITRQIASALEYAHKRGLVHRDIKPSNIMIAADGRYVLTDFGIVLTQGGTKLTRNVETIGTPEYMSPEQVQGRTPDRRSDVYSLGIVLYEMLAGIAPFKAENTLAVLYKHVHEQPATLARVRTDLSAPVVQLVSTAIAKKPEDRFQTSQDMIHALDRAILGKSVGGRRPMDSRRMAILGAAGTMLIASAVVIAVLLTGRVKLPFLAARAATTETPTVTPSPIPTAEVSPTEANATLESPSVADPSSGITEPAATNTAATAPTSTPSADASPTTAATTAPAASATPAAPPTPETAATEGPVVYLTVSSANPVTVRNGPGTDYDSVGEITPGVSIQVWRKLKTDEYTWYQIQFVQSPSGYAWVREDVVTIIGNAGVVPTAEPWVVTPYSATVRFLPRNNYGEIALGSQPSETHQATLQWNVEGAKRMELEVSTIQSEADLGGQFDCPAGNLQTIRPNNAIGKRTVLTLPRGEYVFDIPDKGYYIFNLYIVRADDSETTISRNVIVDCQKLQ